MTKPKGGPTVSRGPAPEAGRDDVGRVAGNVREKDGDPLPDDRARGETSSADDPAPLDLDTAHDRAS